MQSEVIDPLGLTKSSYQASPEILAHLASAYDENLSPYPQRRYTEQAAAGFYATALDLARFVASGLAGPNGELPGRGVITPETLDLMYTPALATDGCYGLGYETYFDGVQFAFHGGDNPGWESTFTAIPELGEGFVSLTNSDTGEGFNSAATHLWIQWLTAVYASANAE
jgi:CubicO group peptidase (beta-lactamase class C family)